MHRIHVSVCNLILSLRENMSLPSIAVGLLHAWPSVTVYCTTYSLNNGLKIIPCVNVYYVVI